MRTAIRRSASATAQLVAGLQTALPALVSLAGLPFLALALPADEGVVRPYRALGGIERDRLGSRLGLVIPAPYRTAEGPHWQRVRTVVTDAASWRGLLWLVLHAFGGLFLGFFAIALWPGILASAAIPAYWWLLVPDEPVTALSVDVRSWTQALILGPLQTIFYIALLVWGLPWAARAQQWLGRRLLGPSEGTLLAREVERLTETRTEALVSHGAELRRIERDLHDGVQAQLVSVSVRLGLAERAMRAEPDKAGALLREAVSGIEDSLGALRDVVRGIYPPILSDRGLAGALRALAGGQRVPVTVMIPDDLRRPPAPIEAAAYFVVAESLTNVAKHSTATQAEVVVEGDGTTLRVAVCDNGQGGARPAEGTGLLGIQRRVAALDGTARIDSPPGAGTKIEVLLPCG